MITPGVVAGTSNTDESTHHLSAELIPVRLNELMSLLHPACLLRRHDAGLPLIAPMLDTVHKML